jgi:hypothetical protein
VSLPAVRRTLLLAGPALIAGLLVAPSLPPSRIFAASIAWYLALILFAGALCVLVTLKAGRAAAVAVLALGLGAPIVLTALPAPPEIAVHLPCPRNWGWLPTWQLRSSPMGSVSFTVDGAPIKVCYGRPAARGRIMLGGSRIPFGQLWRTGANEPTTIITPIPLEVAEVPVPAGRATLYTIPGPESWEVILNRATSQWGIESEYTERVRAEELGRSIVRSERGAAPVERLTLAPDRRPDDLVDLVLAWETTRVRIPVRRSRP